MNLALTSIRAVGSVQTSPENFCARATVESGAFPIRHQIVQESGDLHRAGAVVDVPVEAEGHAVDAGG